ncbi:MATE family efflux transporter [Dyadobacter crusticola]|uniref:MATE family efflux transporter n=1 Tax=Dyadobacter crusticola TaxID=292407 RepID=UPI0004E0D2C3|nr:MATE family efflux transporter [Dyadobacter crusticola]
MSATNQLGHAPVRYLFFQNYGPAIISLLSSILHQVINGIILGQQVGKEGLAAVGLFGPVVIILVALSLPIMIGGGVLIGNGIGAGDFESVQQVFQFATTLVIIIGGFVAICAPFFSVPLARFLAGSENSLLTKNTADYAFWQLVSLPVFFLGMVWGNFVRANNEPKVTRNASVLAAAVNIVLDLILVLVLDMGVEGASIATAIALTCGAAYLFVFISKGKTHFGFSCFRFTLKLSQWKEYFKIGLPSFASEIAFSSGLLFINQALIPYGATAVAAFGLVNYLSFLLIRPFTAAMIAALPIMSFNIGAKQPQRVLDTLRFSLGFTLFLGIIAAGSGLLLSDQLIRLFSGDQSMAYRETASHAMNLYFLLFLAAGPNYLLAAFLQSTGKTIASLSVNLLKGLLLVVPALAILPNYLGLPGIWLSRSLSEILAFIAIAAYTFCYKKRYYTADAILQNS